MIPAEARSWWLSLSDATRAELERSWREPPIGTTMDGCALPIWLEGEVDGDAEDVNQDLLEYILNHDVPFFLEERRFHICREHAPAKAILKRGCIPRGFRCPVRGPKCPMQKMAGGRKVALRARRASSSLDT